MDENRDVAGLLAQWTLEMTSGQAHAEDVALLDEWRRDAALDAVHVEAEVREVFGDEALARPPRARHRLGSKRRQRDLAEGQLLHRAGFFREVRDRIPPAALDDDQVRRVAAHWADLVHGDLEKARAWWAAG